MSSQKWLPHAVPTIASDEEEAVAVVAYLADRLLADFYRQVAAVRSRAMRWSRIAFVIAFLSLVLLLMQDFEFAPVPLLVAPIVVGLLALIAAILLRTRAVAPGRFTPPHIQAARKVTWQWVALPLGIRQGVVLWDTLINETTPLDLPPNPPRRESDEMAIFAVVEQEGLREVENEKSLVRRLGTLLEEWERENTLVQLPTIAGQAEPLLDLLMALPRLPAGQVPPPTLPPGRPLEAGRHDMQQLMEFYRTHRVFLTHLDSWERSLVPLQQILERQFKASILPLDSPPTPPHGHPSGDVEALLGTVESMKAGIFASIAMPLQEELQQMEHERTTRLRVVDEELRRKSDDIRINSEALIRSFERQVKEAQERSLPDAERALHESLAEQKRYQERSQQVEVEIAARRRDLTMLTDSGGASPRAADERKADLMRQIERLQNSLPDAKRSAQSWDGVVATQRKALEREKQRLSELQAELATYTAQRDERLRTEQESHRTARSLVERDLQPEIADIQSDLAYFGGLLDHFEEALKGYRVDLVIEEDLDRPFRQVLNRNLQLPTEKLAATDTWNRKIHDQINKRRQLATRLVEEVNRAALPGGDLVDEILFYVPIWYVESQGGSAAMWPWQARPPQPETHLLAPFVEEPGGRRMAVRGAQCRFMTPHPELQARLQMLLDGPRRNEVLEAARQLGERVLIAPELLSDIAVGNTMPRALTDAISPSVGRPQGTMPAPLVPRDGLVPQDAPGEEPPLPMQGGARVVVAPLEPLSDEFVPATPPPPEDAWQLPPLSAEDGYAADEDAWQG